MYPPFFWVLLDYGVHLLLLCQLVNFNPPVGKPGKMLQFIIVPTWTLSVFKSLFYLGEMLLFVPFCGFLKRKSASKGVLQDFFNSNSITTLILITTFYCGRLCYEIGKIMENYPLFLFNHIEYHWTSYVKFKNCICHSYYGVNNASSISGF